MIPTRVVESEGRNAPSPTSARLDPADKMTIATDAVSPQPVFALTKRLPVEVAERDLQQLCRHPIVRNFDGVRGSGYERVQETAHARHGHARRCRLGFTSVSL